MTGPRAIAVLVTLMSLAALRVSAQSLGGGFGRTATPAPAPPQRPAPVPQLGRVPATPTPQLAPRTTPARPAPSAVTEPQRQQAEVAVGYVLVPAVITDRKGRTVAGLKQKQVTLLSDGLPVAFDFFERSEDAPVSFTLLLDGSGSMGLVGKMDAARAAIRTLLYNRKPGDDFCLHVFSEGSMRQVVPFTTDAGAIWQAVLAIKPWGKTAFYDALAKMPGESLQGKNGSRAIILLTDGLDNASKLTRQELSAYLEGIDVPVYPLGLRSSAIPLKAEKGQSAETVLNLEVLGEVARASGGRLSVGTDTATLEAAVASLLRDLRSQYLIGFTPTGKGPVKFRKLTLRLDSGNKPVRMRAGYRGTEPPLLPEARAGK
ncbi:MAG: VWA domain-containing protein [Acidobacteria bacterium]|nr:VWA domain-containing protein [Acidobacteriota bacterium]